MDKQKYHLNVSFLCSVALEAALDKYRDILPALPGDSMKFIHEWNRALMFTMSQPAFKKELNIIGRMILTMKNPKVIANISDFLVGIPCRSYHYAHRFACAYNHLQKSINNKNSANLIDFGRGCSSLTHLLQNNNKNLNVHTIDRYQIIDDAYGETSRAMGVLGNVNISSWDAIKKFQRRDALVSTGTFVYLDIQEQLDKAKYIVNNVDNFYIELEAFGLKMKDAKTVEFLGGNYKRGWLCNELDEVFPTDIEIKSMLDTFKGFEEHSRLIKSICEDKSVFVRK